MTLERKVAQLWQKVLSGLDAEEWQVTQESLERLSGILSAGSLESPVGAGIGIVAIKIQAAQEYSKHHTRLEISGLPVAKCLHGVVSDSMGCSRSIANKLGNVLSLAGSSRQPSRAWDPCVGVSSEDLAAN
jgi:hypothetical protein